jgi:hypothetical protein
MRRFIISLGISFLLIAGGLCVQITQPPTPSSPPKTSPSGQRVTDILATLSVKGRAPKTGYTRSQFGSGWADWRTCTVRDKIIARDLTNITYQNNTCKVESGTLNDPYTGKIIHFQRGDKTSQLVQIDHVVALSDAWQKGAQQLSREKRKAFANDDLNLMAVDGPANMQKGAGDAATWLPKNKNFRCQYVARQISIKASYSLWVTAAEKAAMSRVLEACPSQAPPTK